MKYFLSILFFVSVACGSAESSTPFLSLSQAQPEVLSISSADVITVMFSHEIDPKTVSNESFFVERLLGENYLLVEGKYQFQKNNTEVIFTPFASWKSGDYQITLTHQIMTPDLLPLKGNEAENYLNFVSHFSVTQQAQLVSEEDAAVSEDVPPEPILSRPEKLVINEILYDVPGSDTDGQVFVELFGTPHAFVDDYSICLVNGDGGEEYDRLTMPANTKVPDDGLLVIADSTNANPLASNVANADLIFNFDPQNGPDCVQLFDDNGELIDALGYGSLVSPCYEGSPALDVPSGSSLSRIEAFDSNNNANDFLSLDLPTPGEL